MPAPGYNQYLLKVVGRFDYLISNVSLLQQAYIQDCLKRDEKIELCLVGRGDIDILVEKEQQWLDGKLVKDHSLLSLEDVEVEPFVSGTHAQLTMYGHNQNLDETAVHTMSLWDLDKEFTVYIAGVENLICNGYESLFVEVGLYLGGELLCPLNRTHFAKNMEASVSESVDSLQLATSSDTKSVKWKCWTKLNILMYNIPRVKLIVKAKLILLMRTSVRKISVNRIWKYSQQGGTKENLLSRLT